MANMAALIPKFAQKSAILRITIPRLYCTGSQGGNQTKTTTEKQTQTTTEKVASTQKKSAPEEPFDNTKYNSTEYYQYNDMSFYDIDNDMAQYRLPQQSNQAQP